MCNCAFSAGIKSGKRRLSPEIGLISPVDPMMLASGGETGTKLFDIRQNSFQ